MPEKCWRSFGGILIQSVGAAREGAIKPGGKFGNQCHLLRTRKKPFFALGLRHKSGTEEGVITKGVFSLEESLDPLYLPSLESLENGRTLLCFPQSWGSLRNSRISTFSGVSKTCTYLREKDLCKRPLVPIPNKQLETRIVLLSPATKRQNRCL